MGTFLRWDLHVALGEALIVCYKSRQVAQAAAEMFKKVDSKSYRRCLAKGNYRTSTDEYTLYCTRTPGVEKYTVISIEVECAQPGGLKRRVLPQRAESASGGDLTNTASSNIKIERMSSAGLALGGDRTSGQVSHRWSSKSNVGHTGDHQPRATQAFRVFD